jgi:hypothetical protein
MRSIDPVHVGLLQLGQCKPKKVKTINEKHTPGDAAPGAIQSKERKDMRSMHLGLMQPRATQTKASTTMKSMHLLGLLRLERFKPQKEKK